MDFVFCFCQHWFWSSSSSLEAIYSQSPPVERWTLTPTEATYRALVLVLDSPMTCCMNCWCVWRVMVVVQSVLGRFTSVPLFSICGPVWLSGVLKPFPWFTPGVELMRRGILTASVWTANHTGCSSCAERLRRFEHQISTVCAITTI